MRSIFIITILLSMLTLAGFAQLPNDPTLWQKRQEGREHFEKIYSFSNGKKIKVSGEQSRTNPPVCSSFEVEVIGLDSILGYWGAEITCYIRQEKDTLVIEQIEYLPLGDDFKYEPALWKTEKFYFQGKDLQHKRIMNRNIKKYDNGQIRSAMMRYETTGRGNYDKKVETMNRIFVATISGSEKSREYFRKFLTEFGTLTDELITQHEDLSTMLQEWDE